MFKFLRDLFSPQSPKLGPSNPYPQPPPPKKYKKPINTSSSKIKPSRTKNSNSYPTTLDYNYPLDPLFFIMQDTISPNREQENCDCNPSDNYTSEDSHRNNHQTYSLPVYDSPSCDSGGSYDSGSSDSGSCCDSGSCGCD